MKKLFLTPNSWLGKAMMLLVLLVISAGAKAQDIQEITLDTDYTVAAFDAPTYSFTAPTTGKVYMYSSTQDFPLLWKDSACTEQINVEINPYNDPRWSYDVVAGTTYYIGYGLSFTMSETVFRLTMQGPAAVSALTVDPEVGGVIAVGNPISIGFTVPVTIGNATLTGGNAEPVQVGFNVNGASASFEVKEILYDLMQQGAVNQGDPVTLTLTDVCASSDPTLKGGEDGTMTFAWTCCPMPISLVKEALPAVLVPLWPEGDPAGVGVLEFSGNLSQGAAASITNGDLSKGGTYEQLPVSVVGNRVYIDFTGVVRFPAVEDIYVLDVWNVCDEAGYPAYSPGAGTVGSYTYSMPFEGEPIIPSYEFTFSPADGSDIKGVDEIAITVGNANSSFSFTEVLFGYTEDKAAATVAISKSDVQVVNGGTEIYITIAVPDAVKAADLGSAVTLTLMNDASIVAYAAYKYGEAPQAEEFGIALISPADGSTLERIAADESIYLNLTGIPADADIEVMGTILDDVTGDIVKWCFFYPEDGSGYNYASMMYDDVDLIEGHTYTLTIEVSSYPIDADGFRGAPVTLGTATFTLYGSGQEYKYSDVELLNMDPNPADDITSADQNVITVTFSGPVSVLRVVEPLGMGAGVVEYKSEKANEDGTEWTFTIPQSVLEHATGSIALSMYAQDAEGLYIYKSAMWDPFMWTGIPEAMQAKDETCFSLMFKCTLGSPDFYVTPADGSKVESIDKFVISYPSGINYSWSVWDDIVLYKDNEEVQRWGGFYFDPWENGDKCEMKNDNPVAWTLELDEVQTEPGVYTLVVPNCFFNLGSEFDQANSKQQTVTVTIEKTDALRGIAVDADADVIYNISGQKVNGSYKGFVIKNGKKVINK